MAKTTKAVEPSEATMMRFSDRNSQRNAKTTRVANAL
jgi:hypothetical protein